MREPIWLLRRRLGENRVTEKYRVFFKLYIRVLLKAFDYLHTECGIIYTGKEQLHFDSHCSNEFLDLRLDNVMMTIEDPSVIEKFVVGQDEEPMPPKVFNDHTVYLSHNNFGALGYSDDKPALLTIFPKIIDFGLAQRGDRAAKLIHPIQTDHSHAPEVILGCG
jgi:serine/threonine-protein kinase SRPK3